MEIMSAPSSRFLAVSTFFCGVACLSLGSLVAGDINLQKVPPLTVEQAPAYPENVARYHFGAQVEALPEGSSTSTLQLSSSTGDQNTAEAALLCDDPTTGYALSTGTKTLVVTLSKIENIDSISFLNHGAKGRVTIATSSAKVSDENSWHVVAEKDLAGDSLNAKVGPTEAKYVKLTFEVSEPGRIASLGVYSTPSVATFTMPRARKMNVGPSDSFALISSNLSDVHSRARAAYVSSGEIQEANNMIDDQSATTYKFGPGDNEPTAVIDLGEVRSLRRITALYTPRPGIVSFYVLKSLPGQPSSNKTMKLDDAALANVKAVGSVSDGSGRAAIDFPETTGRYILVKWKGTAEDDKPFSVAEIAAFGGSRSGNLIASNNAAATHDRYESDGKDFGDGKDLGKDFSKDIPEEGPAENPAPPLSPPVPFTFIPQILPNSP